MLDKYYLRIESTLICLVLCHLFTLPTTFIELPTNAIGFRIGAGSIDVERVEDVEDGCNLGCGFGLLLEPSFVGETGALG